eukprot:16125779-Heterocapsa_arctica.AAC.1
MGRAMTSPCPLDKIPAHLYVRFKYLREESILLICSPHSMCSSLTEPLRGHKCSIGPVSFLFSPWPLITHTGGCIGFRSVCLQRQWPVLLLAGSDTST